MDFNPYDNFIFYDSCAFDGGDIAEQEASKKVLGILDAQRKRIMLMHSVVDEIRNPNTPKWLQDREPNSRQTVKLNLTEDEKRTLQEIENIIVGNGKIEKRKADCFHVFEAQKYGGCFVTTDVDIYKHAEEIFIKYGLYIVKPTKFLELILKYSDKT